MSLTVESYAPGGRNSQTVEASRVLVKDQHGNPLIIAAEYVGGVFVSHFQDPDFEHLLQTFGYVPAEVTKVLTPADVRGT